MITVDGIAYNLPCDIEREAEIQSSDISGMLLNKNYFNDPIATYMKYTVTLVVPLTQTQAYYDLYEVLTNPVASHDFMLPYNGNYIHLTARVEVISDKLYKRYWRNTKFTIIANEPIKVAE